MKFCYFRREPFTTKTAITINGDKENNLEKIGIRLTYISQINTKDILKMVFENGAKATGFEKTESLKVGNLADIVMIDVHKANMEPQTNFVNNLVYAAGVDNVKLTMVDGKILYEDGKYLTLDKDKIVAGLGVIDNDFHNRTFDEYDRPQLNTKKPYSAKETPNISGSHFSTSVKFLYSSSACKKFHSLPNA